MRKSADTVKMQKMKSAALKDEQIFILKIEKLLQHFSNPLSNISVWFSFTYGITEGPA